MKKKTINLLMTAALASSMLAGTIVGYADEADPVTLSVWAPFTGSDGDVLREIIDNYNETNTDNITVQIDIMDNATLQSKLPTAVSTGTGPSFVLVGIEFLQQYAKNGLIEDISDFWDVTGVDKSNFYENVLANPISEMYSMVYRCSTICSISTITKIFLKRQVLIRKHRRLRWRS